LRFPVEVDVALETQSASSPGTGVTAIITLYNYAHFVMDALDSVFHQTHANLDLIVVDDHSSDGSLVVAKTWLEEHHTRFARAKLLRHKANYGLAQSRNTAFESSANEFIFVLDADNEIYPEAIKKLLSACINAGSEAAYSQLEYFGEQSGLGRADVWERGAFRRGNYIDAMALIRKYAWSAVGGYSDFEISGWEDYDLWCKFVEHNFRGTYVAEILCRYRVHKSSMLNVETNPNTALAMLEMMFRHPWLELGLDDAPSAGESPLSTPEGPSRGPSYFPAQNSVFSSCGQ
jgi:glycosyltransferase involved in cell wall biosynthesis